METPYLTVEQYAQHRNVSVRTIFNWMKDGAIPVSRKGRVTRINAAVADSFLDGSGNKKRAVRPVYQAQNDGC